MINDISAGGKDNKNLELAIEYKVPIILMHMKGSPGNMQDNPQYNNILEEILYFFDKKINTALNMGLKEDQIIIDPGIGFGKTIDDNFLLIKNINRFKSLGYPTIIGLSRKSFLSINNDKPKDRLLASIVMMAISVLKGIDIVRVHDVFETKSILNLIDTYKKL